NILLSPDGSIYLADFGLARIAEAGASTLSKDVMLGTPQYISPEQAKGNIELNEGTDVYSFGVVLYELVVGRVPFNADTPFSIIHDHIYTPLPLPSKVNPRVPEIVERVLLKSLAKDPADRFLSVRELIHAFRSALTEGRLPQEVKTAARESAPVHGGALEAGSALSDLDDGEKGADDSAAASKRRRWPWIAAGLGSTLICLLVFVLALGAADQGGPTTANGAEGSTLIDEARETQSTDERDRPAEVLSDPRAAYKRAEQLSENGRQVLAAQGFIRAGQLFLQEEAFIEAAQSYLKAFELDRASFEEQDDVVNGLAQAAFLGASNQQIWPVIERIDAETGEWPLLRVIEARANIFVGDADQTIPLLEGVLREEGNLPLARAVWAEYELQHGDANVAREMLEELMSQPDQMPPWLVEHLQNLMQTFREE
ncbi:MAG: protein kinase, partial [Anaerolineales bacterium]